jgi:hypothetical protein
LKKKLDVIAFLLEPSAVPAEKQAIGADPPAHRIQKHRLQVAAVDRELRPGVAGVPAERFLVYELAEAVVERRLARLDRELRERRLEGELAEHLGSVRQQVDANPERSDLGRRLEDAARDPAPPELQSEREAADPGADDQRFLHRLGAAIAMRCAAGFFPPCRCASRCAASCSS